MLAAPRPIARGPMTEAHRALKPGGRLLIVGHDDATHHEEYRQRGATCGSALATTRCASSGAGWIEKSTVTQLPEAQAQRARAVRGSWTERKKKVVQGDTENGAKAFSKALASSPHASLE